MTGPLSDLANFALLSALTVPSEAAAPMASLEVQALRLCWLDALSELGVTEEQARRLASEARQRALRQLANRPPSPLPKALPNLGQSTDHPSSIRPGGRP